MVLLVTSCTRSNVPTTQPSNIPQATVVSPTLTPTPTPVAVATVRSEPVPPPSPTVATPAVATSLPIPTPEWVKQPTSQVYLNPKSQHAKANEEITVNAEVAPAGWGVSAGELKLSFDAEALEAVKIKAGNLLGSNPLVGAEKIDNKAGTITYALARVGVTPAQTSQDVFATISFKVKANTKGPLKITITQVGLSNQKFDDIKGLMSEGATIIVD